MWLQAKIRAICHSRVELRFIPFSTTSTVRRITSLKIIINRGTRAKEGRKETKHKKSLSSIWYYALCCWTDGSEGMGSDPTFKLLVMRGWDEIFVQIIYIRSLFIKYVGSRWNTSIRIETCKVSHPKSSTVVAIVVFLSWFVINWSICPHEERP